MKAPTSKVPKPSNAELVLCDAICPACQMDTIFEPLPERLAPFTICCCGAIVRVNPDGTATLYAGDDSLSREGVEELQDAAVAVAQSLGDEARRQLRKNPKLRQMLEDYERDHPGTGERH